MLLEFRENSQECWFFHIHSLFYHGVQWLKMLSYSSLISFSRNGWLSRQQVFAKGYQCPLKIYISFLNLVSKSDSILKTTVASRWSLLYDWKHRFHRKEAAAVFHLWIVQRRKNKSREGKPSWARAKAPCANQEPDVVRKGKASGKEAMVGRASHFLQDSRKGLEAILFKSHRGSDFNSCLNWSKIGKEKQVLTNET